MRSACRFLKMNRWPESGSACRRLRTRENRPSKPRRISTGSGRTRASIWPAGGLEARRALRRIEQRADEGEVAARRWCKRRAEGQDEFHSRGGAELDGEHAVAQAERPLRRDAAGVCGVEGGQGHALGGAEGGDGHLGALEACQTLLPLRMDVVSAGGPDATTESGHGDLPGQGESPAALIPFVKNVIGGAAYLEPDARSRGGVHLFHRPEGAIRLAELER